MPWPPNAPRSASEGSFKHFRALATKWRRECLRRLILSIFVPWPPNGPQESLRRLILGIFVHWPPNVPRSVSEGSFEASSCLDHRMVPGSEGSLQAFLRWPPRVRGFAPCARQGSRFCFLGALGFEVLCLVRARVQGFAPWAR